MRGPGVLLYDGDCGFCEATATAILNRAATVPGDQVRPWGPTDELAYGVTPAQAAYQIHYVSPTGAVLGGSLAITAWWRRCGFAFAMLGQLLDLPVVRQLTASGYRWIAEHRHDLSQAAGLKASCQIPSPARDTTSAGSPNTSGPSQHSSRTRSSRQNS